MLNFYTLKQALFAIFSVSFDIKPCLIVSSYKIYVSFTISLFVSRCFLQKYRKILQFLRLKRQFNLKTNIFLTTFNQNLSKNLRFLLLDLVLLG